MFLAEIGDACIVNTDCSDLGENVKCKSLKCQVINEIASNVINNNNNNNYTVFNNNKFPPSQINSVVENTKTKPSRQTSTPTTTNSTLSKSTPSEADFNVITRLVNDLSVTSANYNNNYNILSDTDAEELNTGSKQEFLPSIATNKSREIAVQTSIDGIKLKTITPKVKNVGTITTASNSSSSRRRPRQQQRQRLRPSSFGLTDDTKTISTLSNTDDDVEHQECKYCLKF